MEKNQEVNNQEVNNQQSATQQKNVEDTNNYIEAIKEIKANSVTKEDYEKLKEENKQLLNSLVRGETIQQEMEEKPVDVDQLRKDIFSGELNNLDYMTKSLQLRDELIKRGEKDPFLPYGKNILPTDEDVAKAEKFVNTIKECIDIAEGSNDIFTNELQRRMVDPILPRSNQTRRY